MDTNSRICTVALHGSHPFERKNPGIVAKSDESIKGSKKHAGITIQVLYIVFVLQILNISFQQHLPSSTNSGSKKIFFQDTLPPPNMEPKMGGMSLASLSPAAAVAFKIAPLNKCIFVAWTFLRP